MQQINILNIAYSIYLETGKTETIFTDSVTGLENKIWLLKIEIEPRNKRVQTSWRVERFANGIAIDSNSYSNTMSEEDYNYFEASLLGVMIKKSAINGLFRYNIGNTFAIFNENGEIIDGQPVLWPQIEPEI